MATMRGSRLAVGSSPWIAEERAAATQITESEVEEFSFSARNDFEWLNEHMAGIFDENEINVAEIFKTPGKLRGRTPRTARKLNAGEPRVPLGDIFSGTPKGAPNPFLQQLNRLQSPANTAASPKAAPLSTQSPIRRPVASPRPPVKPTIPHTDSGYHGSQSQETSQGIYSPNNGRSPMQTGSPTKMHVAFQIAGSSPRPSPTKTRPLQSPTATFMTAKEEQTTKVLHDQTRTPKSMETPGPMSPSPVRQAPSPSPSKSSPTKSSPVKTLPAKGQMRSPIARKPVPSPAMSKQGTPVTNAEEARSPSDGSSPIRPVVRKSSINFAALPAREPLTNKSLGGRMSRAGNMDHNRTSYYGRPTGGKSLGNVAGVMPADEMDVDDEPTITQKQPNSEEQIAAHNKTYTQRLQDQISMLGQSQAKAARPSKSIANLVASQPVSALAPVEAPAITPAAAPTPVLAAEARKPEQPKTASPTRKPVASMGPGAFPEEDDDDWIDPPVVPQHAANIFSPRSAATKSHSTDVMEGITKGPISGSEFVLPKQRQPESRPVSPQRRPIVPERTTSASSHKKAASVSAVPDGGRHMDHDSLSPKKGISVSNPTLATVSETEPFGTPSKSPSRTFRDSPLKQVKNKLSSILKSSKGLLASSAAISAEGKSSILSSPSATRLGLHYASSSESMQQSVATFEQLQPLYPDLSRMAPDAQTISSTASPPRTGRKTRASAEKERKERERQKEKEKDAKLLADQMDKLEKAREKEREKARVFSKEQERIAAMEKQVAAQKEQEKEKQTVQKEGPKPTRTSPRKAKAQAQNDGDVEMQDAQLMPPPSAPRSAGPGKAIRPKARGPGRPPKANPAPTVIKVNMGSQHSQYHPSNSTLAANLQDVFGQGSSSQPQLHSKASQSSLRTKASNQSLKSSVSASGRPKALELAAKRKEQEEREAQRKREAKAEIERKRAAFQEEERRLELERRQEAERQREKERELAEAKKAAQRQAAIERAKQTRAPPPAVRSQPNGPPDYNGADKAAQGQPPRPPSRLNAAIQRPQEDLARPVNAVFSNGGKATQKRALPDDAANARGQQARNGSTYQGKDAKRRRTSQEPTDGDEMETLPNIKGPPIRPSAGFKKDMPAKSYGYNNPPQSASRDLFKATVTASAVKASHQIDMAQFSKGAIPFAANPNPPAAKTPARPGLAPGAKSAAKSAPRSSPHFPNGDSIELPEIRTDDEDEDDDEGPDMGLVAAWANSPDLRRALMQQETMDPSQIFGVPGPIVMEEVFTKNKDRWHKFRARSSSANWSGTDRLTEDDIRKDLAGRDKLRRDGGWTYELSREMA